MNITKFLRNGEFINAWGQRKYQEKHLTKEEKEKLAKLPGETLAEKVYLNNHSRGICKCGKPTKFKSYREGYLSYCCLSCKSSNQIRTEESNKKRSETLKKTYENPELRKKIGGAVKASGIDYAARDKKTIELYGCLPMNTKEAKQNMVQTNIKKFGNASSLHGSNHEKIKEILEEKYGINGVQILANKVASENRWKKHYDILVDYCNKNDLEIIDFKIKNSRNMFKCKKCDNEFHRVNGFPLCPHCNKPNIFVSKAEKEIAEYVKSIYPGKIIENDRETLGGNKELDIYLPELKLAIEYNGSYWHGFNRFTDMTIQEFADKTEWKKKRCEQLDINLISIDEFDYLSRPEVFKRFISNHILPKTRINGRDCEVKLFDKKDNRPKEFCETYHVNGFRGGEFKYGLFREDELLAVAIFAKHKNIYECTRLCFKTGIEVVGGWAKIQKHFGKRFLHYVNLKYFRGENKTGVGYRFIVGGKILHRGALQKKTGLSKYCKNYDPRLTDFQNCINNGFIAVFDCGNDIRYYG
jgi:transposase-like protein